MYVSLASAMARRTDDAAHCRALPDIRILIALEARSTVATRGRLAKEAGGGCI